MSDIASPDFAFSVVAAQNLTGKSNAAELTSLLDKVRRGLKAFSCLPRAMNAQRSQRSQKALKLRIGTSRITRISRR
jgi:hypothetical protein